MDRARAAGKDVEFEEVEEDADCGEFDNMPDDSAKNGSVDIQEEEICDGGGNCEDSAERD